MEPYEQAERLAAEADRGAIECEWCGRLIRRGDMKYEVRPDRNFGVICQSCFEDIQYSGEIHGEEDDDGED